MLSLLLCAFLLIYVAAVFCWYPAILGSHIPFSEHQEFKKKQTASLPNFKSFSVFSHKLQQEFTIKLVFRPAAVPSHVTGYRPAAVSSHVTGYRPATDLLLYQAMSLATDLLLYQAMSLATDLLPTCCCIKPCHWLPTCCCIKPCHCGWRTPYHLATAVVHPVASEPLFQITICKLYVIVNGSAISEP